MARNSVRGTPYTHVKASNTEGQSAGKLSGYTGTTGNQYGDDDIRTGASRGTPYQSRGGNGPESKRVASHGKYGEVQSNGQGDANNPKNNGSGIVLDSANSYERGFAPSNEPTLDSPVPRGAPHFDAGFIPGEDRAHLGSGNESGIKGLAEAGGVMSRGMKGTSTPGGAETELTDDDTLPAVAPAGRE